MLYAGGGGALSVSTHCSSSGTISQLTGASAEMNPRVETPRGLRQRRWSRQNEHCVCELQERTIQREEAELELTASN